ncbi:MAG: ABC transporter permease [Candidatus Hodarchaeales archaeon]|jgi:ABC-2 type transport system permease protein
MLPLEIAKRFGKELIRMRISLVVLLALPAFMAFMFWFAFNSAGLGSTETYILGVVNEDEGIADELAAYFQVVNSVYDTGISNTTLTHGFAHDFIQSLKSINYTNEQNTADNIPIFTIEEYDTSEIALNNSNPNGDVESRDIDALLYFPRNYSNTTLSAVNNANFIQSGLYLDENPFWVGPPIPKSDNSELKIVGDEGYTRYLIVKVILSKILTAFMENIHNFQYSGGNVDYEINSVALKEYSIFDTIMPGILVFGILTQSGMLAAFLVSEFAETQTMTRVRLSLIKPWEYIMGVSIYQFIVSFFQMGILFVLPILLLGFRPAGSLIEGFLVLLVTTVFTTGLGFVLAGIFTSSDTAGQSSGFLMTPIAFMSGAFMEVPTITLFPSVIPTASGIPRDFILWDIIPTTHTVNALRSILLYEFSVTDVWGELMLLIIPSILLLVFGMIFYSKRRFAGDI